MAGHHGDERVAVLSGEVGRDLDGFVKTDRFIELAAGTGGMVLPVDRGALDLQEDFVPTG